MAEYYRHHKGGMYEFIGVGRHSETKERIVVYRSVTDGHLWVRPYDMFFEEVEWDGQRVPRFKKEENPETGLPNLPRC